jgi:hypothetical protein
MSDPWFRPNQRGFGPGLPIHRNGWIVLGAYIAALIAFPWVLEWWIGYDPRSHQRFLAIIAISIPFAIVVWRKTDGHWKKDGLEYYDDED